MEEYQRHEAIYAKSCRYTNIWQEINLKKKWFNLLTIIRNVGNWTSLKNFLISQKGIEIITFKIYHENFVYYDEFNNKALTPLKFLRESFSTPIRVVDDIKIIKRVYDLGTRDLAEEEILYVIPLRNVTFSGSLTDIVPEIVIPHARKMMRTFLMFDYGITVEVIDNKLRINIIKKVYT